MSKRTLEYRTELLKRLANPAEADAYLVAAAEDSTGMHIVALKDVIDSLRSRLVDAESVIEKLESNIMRWIKDTYDPQASMVALMDGTQFCLREVKSYRAKHPKATPMEEGK